MTNSGVSEITDHLMHGRGLTICARNSLASQERFSNRPSCATPEHVAPTASPRGLSTLAEHFKCIARLGSGQSGLEFANLGGPTSCHLTTQDNQTTSSVFPRQLQANSDLVPPRIDERCPVLGGCPCPGGPVHRTTGGHLQRLPDVVHPTCRNPMSRRTCWQSLGHLLPGRFGPPHARSRNPADPAPLPLHKLHGGGKTCRVDGHTCRCVVTKGVGGEDGGATTLGNTAVQSETICPWGNR